VWQNRRVQATEEALLNSINSFPFTSFSISGGSLDGKSAFLEQFVIADEKIFVHAFFQPCNRF